MGRRRRSGVRRVIGSAVRVVTAIAATGCAHALSQPMPDLKGRLAVKISNEQPSKMSEMPLGVHQIPDTSVYVSGHQGAAGVGMLFGIIGVAVAHAPAQTTGEKKTQDARAQLRLDIPKLAEQVLTEELARRTGWTRTLTWPLPDLVDEVLHALAAPLGLTARSSAGGSC